MTARFNTLGRALRKFGVRE